LIAWKYWLMTAWIAVAPGYRAAAGASAAASAAVVGGVEDGCAEVGGAEDGATDSTSGDDAQPSRRDGLDGTGEGGTECLTTAIRAVGA
jgi:hypothetical protein